MNLILHFFLFLFQWSIYFLGGFFSQKLRKERVRRFCLPPTSEAKFRFWFHCSSLGEFELVRDLIELFKKNYPDSYILITFFSSSGYDNRKNYEFADHVTYLPFDSPIFAKRWIQTYSPTHVFWVKYDFWYFYLKQLKFLKIPIFLVSAHFSSFIFIPFYKTILSFFTSIFVINTNSQKKLVDLLGIPSFVSGDSKYDRALRLRSVCKVLPEIDFFKNNTPLLIIGSAWEEDFQCLLPVLNDFKYPLKIIIVPHEIKHQSIEIWRNKLKSVSILYSEIQKKSNFQSFSILIVDKIGLLACLYQHADFAWIGGGFRQGLHNILEPATWGIPLFFGNKKIEKFPESATFLEAGIAQKIKDSEDFRTEFTKIYTKNKENKEFYKKESLAIINHNSGTTLKIYDYLLKNNFLPPSEN